MTDQALAARVEELTTLQEIDRELSASLDIGRVLDVTLSWALQGTGATHGTLSILEEAGAHYTLSCCTGDQETVQTDPSLVRRALNSQEPFLVGKAQMLVPIRYDNETVGLLDLRAKESSPFQSVHAQFAGRLAGHAAVAIENARLYDKVRHASKDKADFVSYVAHELRTPMTSIRGYADMLAKELLGPLTPDQAKFIGTITRNAERMQILISDLQDTTRIESDLLRLDLKPTSLADALHEALQAVQEKIKARSHQLTTEIPEDLPQVQADPKRLEQTLTELLRNGIKYTPEGGKIGLRTWMQADYVHCSISDSGVGISLKDQARLFNKFFRSESPAIREMPGTGLGLFVVRHLVESQGGEITIESQVDVGTTVTFTVPLAPQTEVED
jgi:signal transduction histidine kinase